MITLFIQYCLEWFLASGLLASRKYFIRTGHAGGATVISSAGQLPQHQSVAVNLTSQSHTVASVLTGAGGSPAFPGGQLYLGKGQTFAAAQPLTVLPDTLINSHNLVGYITLICIFRVETVLIIKC